MNNIKSTSFDTPTLILDSSITPDNDSYLVTAVQSYLDTNLSVTSLRFGHSLDPNDFSLYLMENMYGPKLKVFDSNSSFYDWKSNYISHQLKYRQTEENFLDSQIKEKTGVDILSSLTPHPDNMDLSTNNDTEQMLKEDLVQFINESLPEDIYQCILIKDKFTWLATSKYINSEPTEKFISDLKSRLEKYNKKMSEMIQWNGAKFELKPLVYDKNWKPMDWSVVEPKILELKHESMKQDKSLGTMVLQSEDIPLTRGSYILFDPIKKWYLDSNNKLGGYSTDTTSDPAQSIGKDIEHYFDMADNGVLGFLPYTESIINETAASYMYHLQAFALERELGKYLEKNFKGPIDSNQNFNPMPKELSQLSVGDRVFVSGNSLNDNPMWCTVKKKDGNILSLFIENGHWQFDLDIVTNKSLSHEIASIEGLLNIQSTDPSPYPHGSMYNDGIAYYQKHLSVNNTTLNM